MNEAKQGAFKFSYLNDGLRATALWHLTHLGKPQSAARVSTHVPCHRAIEPRVASMGTRCGIVGSLVSSP
jgi:hypothetical protein